MTLSVDARPREEAHSPRLEVWQEEEGVLSLRVVDPGRLVVKASDEVIAAGALGWGEDQRLRVDPLEDYPPEALPRVVNREPGWEEVEVHVRAEAGAGEQLTLTYEWDWKHTVTLQRWVREQLRGIATEMLTEDNAQKLFPGFRLTGRQVIEEARILEKTKQLRAALRLPEDLSGGAP